MSANADSGGSRGSPFGLASVPLIIGLIPFCYSKYFGDGQSSAAGAFGCRQTQIGNNFSQLLRYECRLLKDGKSFLYRRGMLTTEAGSRSGCRAHALSTAARFATITARSCRTRSAGMEASAFRSQASISALSAPVTSQRTLRARGVRSLR